MVYSLLPPAALIGDGRLADQLAVAHGEAVLKRNLFADGQRGRTQLLAADSLVADRDIAQFNIAGVGERILDADLLPLACAAGGDGIRRGHLRRGGFGLNGHRDGTFILLQAIGGLDIIPNEVLDFSFFNLVLCHMPCAVVSHALLALQPVVFNDGMSGRVKQRNLLGHVLLTAVVNLDGDGHVLFRDNGLRLAER